jgi:hypothetical protein
MRISRASVFAVLAALAACHHRNPATIEPQDVPPLASYATQHVVLTPTTFVHATDSLGWVTQAGGPRAVGRALDSMLVTALDVRGLTQRWVLPADLVRSYERNRTYATDPYQLTADALRGPEFRTMSRYAEPLASQLRTMIALHDDTRYVLLPVAVRFEKTSATQERAVIRAALLDARATEARWVGDVRGDAAGSASAALASAADRLADNFGRP